MNKESWIISSVFIFIQRGLRHCLSSDDGQCEGLQERGKQEFGFPRFSFCFLRNGFLSWFWESAGEKKGAERMTTFDLINVYLFNYTSSKYRGGLSKNCCTMIEEMNEIRDLYWAKESIEDVLKQCVCCRHGHQYCIPEDAVTKAVDALKESVHVSVLGQTPLVEADRLVNSFVDFEDLYDFVSSVIGHIKGIGPLTVYDTAKRIGHLFETPIYPCQYVYLSAGALDGAKAMLGTSKLKFREPTKLFEPFFGSFPSIFIEDILCIFKSAFTAISGVGLTPLLKIGNCVFKTVKSPRII